MRFKSLKDLQGQYSEEQILTMVSRYLDDKDARSEYHRKYNARKTATYKMIKDSHPELFAKVQ